ncbi:hypothetical protein QBC37DRAFT_477385 [Rhypophila decipiens]|uniref:endo-1,4-beta-xylanase n=1 Tax=Rhypophila decipiens TaxID=261697 RepID=A0AAN6YJE6_9PEZI|nr:hypothetical protein QBC37DRAFT_477385 [Rhypophila decipiens]
MVPDQYQQGMGHIMAPISIRSTNHGREKGPGDSWTKHEQCPQEPRGPQKALVTDHGTYDPANGFTISRKGDGGEIKVDGGRYKVGVTRSVLMQLPEGFQSNTITRVFSVRQGEDKRRAGTVSMRAHVDVWRDKFGVDLEAARLNYQPVAVEGYLSSGEAEVTASEA